MLLTAVLTTDDTHREVTDAAVVLTMGSSARSVLLLAVLTMCGQSAHSSRPVALDFMYALNGDIDNSDQVASAPTEHDFVQARFIPILIPALESEQQVYVEIAVNGKMVAMYIAEVRQENLTQEIVTLTQYNFTDFRKHKPGEFNITELKNLTRSDIHTDPNCKINFVSFDNGTVFVGVWSDCKYTVKQYHPAFTVMIMCDAVAMTVPLLVAEKPASLPYIFPRKSPGYPVRHIMPCYIPPCRRRRPESELLCASD